PNSDRQEGKIWQEPRPSPAGVDRRGAGLLCGPSSSPSGYGYVRPHLCLWPPPSSVLPHCADGHPERVSCCGDSQAPTAATRLSTHVRRQPGRSVVRGGAGCQCPATCVEHVPGSYLRRKHAAVSDRQWHAAGTSRGTFRTQGQRTRRGAVVKPLKPVTLSLQALVQDFFEKHLAIERHASRHTVLAYRDSLKLFLRHAAERLGCAADDLDHATLDVEVVRSFLGWLENQRKCAARTRNHRLAAIKAFARYAASVAPAHLERCRRIRELPPARFEHPEIKYLDDDEILKLVKAIDPAPG